MSAAKATAWAMMEHSLNDATQEEPDRCPMNLPNTASIRA